MEGITAGADAVTKTPRLQQILEAAAEIATLEGHSYVGVEHVALAMLADRSAVPTQVMQRLGLDIDNIGSQIAAAMHTEGYTTPRTRATLLDGTVVEH